MPIMSPTGHLAGVLNIPGDVCGSFTSAGRLVRHAVAHIERNWVEELATDLVVRLHPHPSCLGTPEESVLSFHDGLLMGASSRALAYLGLTPRAIGDARWEQIFQQRPMPGRCELRRVDVPGLYYAASARIAATERPRTLGRRTLKTSRTKPCVVPWRRKMRISPPQRRNWRSTGARSIAG